MLGMKLVRLIESHSASLSEWVDRKDSKFGTD